MAEKDSEQGATGGKKESAPTQDFDHLKMERLKGKLVDIIDSEFGLLDKLLKIDALTYNETEKIRTVATLYERNGLLLNYIFEKHKHLDLISSLSDAGQIHVVNYIRGNGKYSDEFGLDWPLTDKENGILKCNQEELVDTLDSCELLPVLYSNHVISKRQRDFVDSERTGYARSEALLRIIRRLSQRSYVTVINCLRTTNQAHIADIFENGGAIVSVHITMQSHDLKNLDEAETQIVDEMANMLMRRNVTVEEANRLLSATQLKIIAAKRGESVVLYVCCCKEEEFDYLCEAVYDLEMRNTLERFFNSLLRALKVKILSMIISDGSIMKARQFFKNFDHLKMELLKDKLVDIIDSESRLLDKLLRIGALTNREIQKIETGATLYDRNELLLNYIFEKHKHSDLISSLSDAGQIHVVNYIRGNGEYSYEFGLNWPLTDKENGILDCNQEALVNTLDTSSGLLSVLYSFQVINRRQLDFVNSKPTDHERNEALLGIVRRSSQRSYVTAINGLRTTNQAHIADIFENGGAIVPFHITMQSDNLDEAETQIVDKITDILMRRNVSEEEANRLLSATQLKIIAAKRGESVVLYVCCCKEEEFDYICEAVDDLEMRDTLERLFNSFFHALKVKILSMIISDGSIMKARQFFKKKMELEIREKEEENTYVSVA